MKIEKDAEWNRLEGRVGQLRDQLRKVNADLQAHAKRCIASQLGVVVGETIVESKGVKFLLSDVDTAFIHNPWVHGRKFRKDGTPSEKAQCLYNNWTIVQP